MPTKSLELAHQWFGNLVTMDWWSELWLNEGFATWVGWLAVDHFHPGMAFASPFRVSGTNKIVDWNVWSQFVVRNARGILKMIDIDEFFRLKVSNKLPNSTHYAPPTPLKFL